MSDNKNTREQRRKNTKAKTSKQKRNSSILAILLVIIVIIIAVVVFSNLLKKDTDSKNNENGTNTESESYVEELGDGIVLNKSRALNETKEIGGFVVSNIQLTTKDGMTTLLADVKNNTGAKTTLKTAEITLLDNNNEEVVTVKGIINEMEAGGTSKLNISMTSNYVNAYDFKIEIR